VCVLESYSVNRLKSLRVSERCLSVCLLFVSVSERDRECV